MDVAQIERTVAILDTLLREEDFKANLDAYCATSCDTFEDAEENKLEYTSIFQGFQAHVEQYLHRKACVDLHAFLEHLPEYMDRPDAHEQTGAIFDLLNAFTDFSAFKDMMLQLKKTNAAGGHAGPVSDMPYTRPESLAASLELTRILENGGAEDGWQLVADKGWIQTYRKLDPDSPIHMTRCFARVNIPAEALVNIFMDPWKKTQWDTEVKTCEVIGGNGYAHDGYIVRQTAKIPLCTPREMVWRWQLVPDWPEPGCFTGVIHDEPTDVPPMEGHLRVECKIANTVIRPDGPDSCHLTMFGHMSFHFPAFVWNYTSSSWLIRNVTKLETAYKTIYQGNPPPMPA
ncbi:unnamed protein product [Polarella glacialis]|uniref:ADP-ribosylation factor-like protein 2-binding protein n=1 Tax=Polarella glacialis TaxID=89957 RepID=A0A813EDL5_POLGL|nr:unnamed protein product [Polarella glacialis]